MKPAVSSALTDSDLRQEARGMVIEIEAALEQGGEVTWTFELDFKNVPERIPQR